MARFIMASSSGMIPWMAIMYCSGSGRKLNERDRDRGLGEKRSGRSGVEWSGVEKERRGGKKDGLYQNTQLLGKMLLLVL